MNISGLKRHLLFCVNVSGLFTTKMIIDSLLCALLVAVFYNEVYIMVFFASESLTVVQ
ncbi:hypothetical protein PGR03_14250 [Klebsiella sp. 141196]|mgnify:FL=1|uniref:hypothetical protein n=1 Tax=Klebsiella TaxID=570 RepID=UPI0028DDEFC8|nr:hypothetical protein [Klebsiella aerogenes]MDT8882098.1 hypothetical protein [Klebsiella aerogenes]HBV6392529.1 hypothetical protein [Klebsiella aerogenes]HCM7225148.1 hypothetical protein [Klebsiella aerogenes]